MPCSSGGSSFIHSKRAWVGQEKLAAVCALSWAIEAEIIGAPSIRRYALSWAAPSHTAMHMLTLSSRALAAAAATARRAVSSSIVFVAMLLMVLARLLVRRLPAI